MLSRNVLNSRSREVRTSGVPLCLTRTAVCVRSTEGDGRTGAVIPIPILYFFMPRQTGLIAVLRADVAVLNLGRMTFKI